ncbi:MAG: M20/M25/M40 family metallo-hydrolase, partial [Gammaproteobacteria bacterium]|nr:M20/M25/M40 family metallo-hydrolase [Gammaproteobacteria bacterium]
MTKNIRRFAGISSGGLLLGLLSLAMFPASARADAESDGQARDLYEDLVNFPSSKLRGGTREIAEFVGKTMLAGGFPAEDVHVLGPREDILGVVVRYRGRGEGRPVMMMAHLDVVEALREDWNMDPFTFMEKDGYFYGRGTSDNKAGDAVLIANFLRLKKEGFVPARDMIMVLSGDEETVAESIKYLLAEQRDLVDAEFSLNTDGGGIPYVDGKPAAFVIQGAEKVYLTFKLEVANPGGHSSVPRPDNAIYELAAGLVKLAEYKFPVSLNDVTRSFFQASAMSQDPEHAAAMQALVNNMATPEQLALLAQSPVYNSMMRTTCVATELLGGHAENALPQMAQATVNCRVLPQDSPSQVEATLKQVLGNDGIKMTATFPPIASPPSPMTPAIIELLGGVAGQMYPGLPV